jgi:methionyl aminopeptidase
MRFRSNDACWCGSGAKLKRCHLDRRALARPAVGLGTVGPWREVPESIERPRYVLDGLVFDEHGTQVLAGEPLERMRRAARVAAEVLSETVAAVAPGVTTDDLDAVAHRAYVERGAYPSTLGYHGYPKSICTSVNEVVCHGIPDDRPLQEGDIVNVDVTAYLDGMHGDTSATVGVGSITPELAALVETTRVATLAGIAAIAPGEPLRAVAEAIVAVTDAHGYGIVAEYGGHGIGTVFHAAPHVNHTVVSRDHTVLVPGMTITVEPMLTTGRPGFHQADDGWTEILDDGMPSAQFEHTVTVTDDGVEILTVAADGSSALDPPVASAGTVTSGPAAAPPG